MTMDEIKDLAGRFLRPVLGEENVEEIVVHENDDWSGAASLYVDVFVVPGFSQFDFGAWGQGKFELSEELRVRHEPRFPYVQIRDRREESEEAGQDEV